MELGPHFIDGSKSLEQLTGEDWGEPDSAPTPMVETILRAGKKPLVSLDNEEVWLCISQHCGFPFILDLVWPMLKEDPLSAFWHYEGDVLSSLIRAPDEVWSARPQYRSELEPLKKRAMAAPDYLREAFLDSLEHA